MGAARCERVMEESRMHMHKIECDTAVSTASPFQGSFEPIQVAEILLECDPKQPGTPICILQGEGGATQEVHAHPMRSRPGRYKARVKGEGVFNAIQISMARDKPSHLIRMKLVGSPAGS